MWYAQKVTDVDVTRAVGLMVDALRDVPDDAWDAPAGTLSWSCWETVEHAADDLFAYAAQLGPASPPTGAYLPMSFRRERPEGPMSCVFVDRSAGTAGLLQVLEACGTLLSAVVATVPAERRAYHPCGLSDPEGFAAMGVVELLVHGYDVAAGLGRPFEPPADLCDLALVRLFPDAPSGGDRWATLLWATGRGALPDRPVQQKWDWDARPAAER